jgi:conjugative relaxase-like TrwC/TraI family protein
MLNIGRMAPGRADYYLEVVADRDATDYYLAPGEEPGRWLLAGGLDLDGIVQAEQLRAVLDGKDPDTGAQLAAHPARKVPGFDLTYRPPKSVSLLWALGDAATAAEVSAAHEAAVAAAVAYLEREAARSRRGAGGTETVRVDGFVAATFRHRTSRANDPLLHTHVLIANLARTSDDGVWRTLDSRRLYAHAKTAGVLYQAQLRHELARRLGVGWQPVVNGVADIAGVGRPLIEAFSSRRIAIVEQLSVRGETSAKAAQVATLATRAAKGERLAEADLRTHWHAQAAARGLDAGWTNSLLGRTRPQRPDLAGIAGELVDREALTAAASTFTRCDLLQAIAQRLPTGAPVALVEVMADKVMDYDPQQLIELGAAHGPLSSVEVIRRADGRIVAADPDARRYTTRGLLLLEKHTINVALRRTNHGVAVLEPAGVDRTLTTRTLTAEQAAMVRRLTSSGAGVEVVVGKAGTGKTYALDAARHAWNAAGIPVTGVALAARAALELEQSAGIRSSTLTSLLGRLDRDAPRALPTGSVLVVDEAGMVGTRQLARLLHHAAEREVKVVLVGDPHQLPEIDAGGLFRALATRLPAIELTDNRRQQHAWEQTALDQLRHGDPSVALDTYREHGRIVTAQDPQALREQLVDDWWTTARTDPGGSIMIGLRRFDVDDLNHRARARLHTERRLTGPTLTTGGGGIELQVGDRIVCLRNSQRHGVVNGTRATIVGVDAGRRQIDAITDDGRPISLTSGYLDAGHVAHGYAITGHKAQGLTCEHTYVLGSEALYREWGYVALSRGRQSNRLYQSVLEVDLDEIHPHVHHPDDPDTSLAARMTRTRAHEPVSPAPHQLAARWRYLNARLHDLDIARQRTLAAERAQLDRSRQGHAGQLGRLERRIDDTARGLGRMTGRRLTTDLRAEHDRYRAALAGIDQQLDHVDRELAGLPSDTDITEAFAQWRRHARQIDTVAHHHVASGRPSAHLLTALGPMPVDRPGRDAWEQTAIAIESYRLRWSVTDPDRPLGGEPDNPLQQTDRQRALAAIDSHQQRLAERQRDRQHGRGLSIGRSR